MIDNEELKAAIRKLVTAMGEPAHAENLRIVPTRPIGEAALLEVQAQSILVQEIYNVSFEGYSTLFGFGETMDGGEAGFSLVFRDAAFDTIINKLSQRPALAKVREQMNRKEMN